MPSHQSINLNLILLHLIFIIIILRGPSIAVLTLFFSSPKTIPIIHYQEILLHIKTLSLSDPNPNIEHPI